jgi:thiol-disulfide isomerase/thioredoxin
MKPYFFLSNRFISLTGIGLLIVLLSFIKFTFIFDSILRVLILSGLFSGYLRFNFKIGLNLLANILIPLALATTFLLYFLIVKEAKFSFELALLLYGVPLLAFGLGLFLRYLRFNSLYKKTILLGFIILFIFATSRRYGEGWFAVCTIISFILASVYLASYNPARPVIIANILFATVFIVPMLESELSGIMLTSPVIMVGGLMSYFTLLQMAKRTHTSFSRIMPLLILLLLSPVLWVLQENYAMAHYSSYNNTPDSSVNIILLDKHGETIIENHGQTTVYLFWSATCSMCKKEFPHFSKLASRYQNRKDIKFYAVFLEFREIDTVVFNREILLDYDFEWAWIPQGKVLYDSLIMNGVPHISIIDKNNTILYNGKVSNRPWLYINHPNRFLQN